MHRRLEYKVIEKGDTAVVDTAEDAAGAVTDAVETPVRMRENP